LLGGLFLKIVAKDENFQNVHLKRQRSFNKKKKKIARLRKIKQKKKIKKNKKQAIINKHD
jgi:hypothetical protein